MRIVHNVICTSQRNLKVGSHSSPATDTIRSSRMFEKHLQRSRNTGAICCRRNPGSVQCSKSTSGRSDSSAKSCGVLERSDKQNFLAPSSCDKNCTSGMMVEGVPICAIISRMQFSALLRREMTSAFCESIISTSRSATVLVTSLGPGGPRLCGPERRVPDDDSPRCATSNLRHFSTTLCFKLKGGEG